MIGRGSPSAPGLIGILVLASCWAFVPAVTRAQAQSVAAPVRWAKVSVDLPTSDSVFPPGDGAQFAGYCEMCHSSGMVLRQPPLTKAQWLAEIQKMRAFFGSPMPADKDAALAAYLARINGPKTPESHRDAPKE